jgi:ribosomal protein S18 acetylase RimI-like enzyme
MRLREARPEDAERIAEISRVALGYASSPEDTRRRLIRAINNPTHFLRVAEDENGRAIGFIQACGYESLYCDPLKYVMMLAVDPAYQGKGIGKALLTACEEWARAEGAEGVRLSSGSDRLAAHQFYLHLGYRIRKEQKSIVKLF